VSSPSPDRSKQPFHEIVGYITGVNSTVAACGLNVAEQFQPDENGHFSVPRNINAAFLVALSGENHPRFVEAKQYLDEMEKDPLWSSLVVRSGTSSGGVSRVLSQRQRQGSSKKVKGKTKTGQRATLFSRDSRRDLEAIPSRGSKYLEQRIPGNHKGCLQGSALYSKCPFDYPTCRKEV
jgi:hypothetical protein